MDVTIRDLRNRGGEVIDRVAAGEHVIITRDGRPVAELRPLRPAPLSRAALLQGWRRVPYVDPQQFRADLDSVVDPAL